MSSFASQGNKNEWIKKIKNEKINEIILTKRNKKKEGKKERIVNFCSFFTEKEKKKKLHERKVRKKKVKKNKEERELKEEKGIYTYLWK